MRVVLEHFRIQNCILWLLVISGALKPLLIYYNVKPDLTLLVLIAMILDILFVIISRIKIFFERTKLFFLMLIVAFYTFCQISLLYSPSPDYGMEKAFYMIIPCLGFIYPFFLRKLDLGMLYNMIFFLVVPVSLWFILFKFLLYNDGGFLNQIINRNRFLELRQDYLNLGYLLGILVLMAQQYSKKSFVVIFLGCLLMLGLGSRGALVFTLLSFSALNIDRLFLRVKNLKIRLKKLRQLTVFGILIIGCLVVFWNKLVLVTRYGILRFQSLLSFSGDSSAMDRLEQYKFALERIFTLKGFIIGHGLGSWGVIYYGIDEKAYPHNIFLEAWFEVGIIGFLVLIAVFIPVLSLKREKVLKLLALFALLNALKSSSFAYDRNLFIIFGVLIFAGDKLISKRLDSKRKILFK